MERLWGGIGQRAVSRIAALIKWAEDLQATTRAFSVNDGADTIGDFFAGGPEDRIWFVSTSLHNFGDVLANAVTSGGNTVITYNGFFTVTLNGVTAGQLTAGDFIFT